MKTTKLHFYVDCPDILDIINESITENSERF